MKEGLKEKPLPTGFERFVVRMPIFLYRIGLGFVFGKRFLILTHTGRNSGLKRFVVLEVVHHDLVNDRYFIASGWGEKSNWYQNVANNPNVEFQIKNQKFNAYATKLENEKAADVLFLYASKHPNASPILSKRIIGQRLEPSKVNCILMADYVPVVMLNKLPHS